MAKEQQLHDEVTPESVRVMIILANDCGLLAEAMYFLSGQSFKERATLVLPTRLFSLNSDDLGVNTREYASPEELFKVVDEESPDIVVLFSGYLLAHHKLLPERSLENLIDHLARRGCRVATSDPLAGIMSSAVAYSASSQAELDRDKNFSEDETVILRIFIEAYEVLKTTTHIYPYPYETVESKRHSTPSFFNPRPTSRPKTPSSPDFPGDFSASSSSSSYWFFTMGPEDYKMQCLETGKDELVAVTAAKFQWISELGRNVILVGPDDFIQAMESALPTPKRIRMFSFLSFMEFNTLNLNAEYAFYWNVASASALIRELNSLPTFHFSIGHIGRALPPVYSEVVRLFYAGSSPIMIDQMKTFNIRKIKKLTKLARKNFAKVLKVFEPLPSSAELIEKLINPSNQR